MQKSLGRIQSAIAPKRRGSSGTLEVDTLAINELQAAATALNGSAGSVPQFKSSLNSANSAAVEPGPPLVTMGTRNELIEMLAEPSMTGPRFRGEFFFALNYASEPSALLERIWRGVEAGNKFSDRWMDVLKFWVTEHFYYFGSSQPLMTNLLQKIKSKRSHFCPSI